MRGSPQSSPPEAVCTCSACPRIWGQVYASLLERRPCRTEFTHTMSTLNRAASGHPQPSTGAHIGGCSQNHLGPDTSKSHPAEPQTCKK